MFSGFRDRAVQKIFLRILLGIMEARGGRKIIKD